MDGSDEGVRRWNPPGWWDILRWPLPSKGPGDRILIRAIALAGRGQLLAIRGIEHILPDRDPFILVANHSSRRDTVLVPAFLMLHRGGRPVHFLADWNFRLIPGVGMLYSCAGAITVTRKPARPQFLNVLKRFYDDPVSPIERTREHLVAGRSVAIYPEGVVNHDPIRLLAGHSGAARLSLETAVPVVPMGIRAVGAEAEQMEMIIGQPLIPPTIHAATVPQSAVRNWHAMLMSEIARLSGKTWLPPSGNRRD
jgi:1-acyl-sn-glycerol-3-phosphate acyltransferase